MGGKQPASSAFLFEGVAKKNRKDSEASFLRIIASEDAILLSKEESERSTKTKKEIVERVLLVSTDAATDQYFARSCASPRSPTVKTNGSRFEGNRIINPHSPDSKVNKQTNERGGRRFIRRIPTPTNKQHFDFDFDIPTSPPTGGGANSQTTSTSEPTAEKVV